MGKKATFILKENRECMSKKQFKSMDAFVEKGLKEIAKIKQIETKGALLDASRDTLFLADLKEIEEDFACADFKKAG